MEDFGICLGVGIWLFGDLGAKLAFSIENNLNFIEQTNRQTLTEAKEVWDVTLHS